MNDHLQWKTLSSAYVFEDKWLRARKDVCQRPDGKIIDPYYVIEYMPWATAVCMVDDENVILIRQYRQAIGEVCLELPGGCIDPTDASNEAAVKREVLEETGYVFNEAYFLGATSPNPSTNNNMLYMFLLKDGKKMNEQDLDANEEIEVVSMPLTELVQKLKNNEILSAMHVTNIMYALQHMGKLRIEL